MEDWKIIPSTDYYVSSKGRIKHFKHNRWVFVSLSKTNDGYSKCTLFINGKAKYYRVHRLVANAFIPNPLNKPTVNHIDGNKDNNSADNLEWSTLSEQMVHAYATGLKKPVKGCNHPSSTLTQEQVDEIRSLYKPHDKQFGMIALAKRFNVSEVTISRIVRNKSYINVK